MPTQQEKLEAIRAACIKANPSIMDMEWGCEARQGKDMYIILAKNAIYKNTSYLVRQKESGAVHDSSILGPNWHVLGRPIRLADVLLAIITKDPANRTRVIVESSGQFIFCVFGDEGKKAGPSWNLLKDSLTDQSPETIDFLYQLLK